MGVGYTSGAQAITLAYSEHHHQHTLLVPHKVCLSQESCFYLVLYV
jgi:hypothetical protein